ncbi:hypothetical protein S7711_10112 [Stachybotrys chartarum IBT 7711]|uniref:Chalcone/stilbene synthase N-terminal domain-containing protein n=1 Tax=Stachybotrys chartarum (strain CBS 109288 / IBT 7711) TaxID=1280523 RepID=A0A084B516_STACB|nr:hypothetical protein S7711_10112 [Stachybotrys chartarum IBT 7711]
MSSSSMPAYYELSWAILSTIGLANVFFGITVVGIVGFSLVALVPITVSAACAIANGMCYYAFYTDYPIVNRAVASAFADFTWLVLQNTSRVVFLSLFWVLITAVSSLRIAILIIRTRYILNGSKDGEALDTITSLHIGYFTTVALVECLNAVFLLRKFHWARWSALNVSLFSYLMRSTEIRLAMLALVGITRAVTYSFQTTAQSATSISSQLDRFAYTLECVFPVMMFIDILAARLVFAHNSHSDSYMHNGPRSTNHASQRLADLDEIDLELSAILSSERIPLEVKAARKAIAEANIDVSQITHVVFTTCTDAAHPGYDHYMAQQLGLPNAVEKVPLHGVGCSGGLATLRTVANLALGHTTRGKPARVLCVALEVVTLLAKAELDLINELQETRIGACLFSDGSRSVVLSNSIGKQSKPIYQLLGWKHSSVREADEILRFDGIKKTHDNEGRNMYDAVASTYFKQYWALTWKDIPVDSNLEDVDCGTLLDKLLSFV